MQAAYIVGSGTRFQARDVFATGDKASLDEERKIISPLLRVAKKLFQYDVAEITEIQRIETVGEDSETFTRPLAKRRRGASTSEISKNDHPLDKIMTLIYHSDDPLLQDLLVKLATCNIAIPWIYQGLDNTYTYLSWALQNITIKFSSQYEIMQEQSLISTKFHLISFVRFGKTAVSKSVLASKVLSADKDDEHHYFCHGLSRTRAKKLSVGVVDAAWYLPTEQNRGQFSSESYRGRLLVANLHGCASCFPDTTSFLVKQSQVMCILISEIELENHMKNIQEYLRSRDRDLAVIFLLDFQKEESSQTFESAVKDLYSEEKDAQINTSANSVVDAVEDIREHIGEFVRERNEVFSIKKGANQLDTSIMQADSQLSRIAEAQDLGAEICQLMTSEPKERILKLQEHSINIAQCEKDCGKLENRPKNLSFDEYITKRHSEIMEHQTAQIETVKELSDDSALIRFLDSAHEFSERDELLTIFVRSFQYDLDETCRNRQTRFKKVLKENEFTMADLKKNCPGEQFELERLEKSCEEIKMSMESSELGMEHVAREMAVLESTMSRTDSNLRNKEWANRLPELQAKMLLQGVPLEIMDGDSGSVPLEWIRKVFSQLKKCIQLEGKKIAIISVLGVQSSGKSTMLNTAFGLNFAVSAGRCTRGVYAQLLPLEAGSPKNLDCDYILLLDTEGIRAPERFAASSSCERDNELATFVVGISDLTIISVMGEVGTEICEVMQIVMQAILRMKNVMISPNCIIAHQNITDPSASENTMNSRRRIEGMMNEAAQYAGKMEGYCVTDFSEIINFHYDDPTSTWFIPPLLNGKRISTNYVGKILKLKRAIFAKLAEKEGEFAWFDIIPQKLNTIWKALMKEDFVFHFKNSTQIIAYRSLESEAVKWYSILSETGWEWERTCINKINGQVESSGEDSAQKGRLCRETLLVDLQNTMSKKLKQVAGSVETFFSSSPHKMTLEQWHRETLDKLDRRKEAISQEVWSNCFEVFRSKEMEEDFINSNSKIEARMNEILRKNLSTVTPPSGRLDEINQYGCTQLFEKAWNGCLDSVIREEDVKEIKKTDINSAFRQSIESCFDKDLQVRYAQLIASEGKRSWDIESVPPKEWSGLITHPKRKWKDKMKNETAALWEEKVYNGFQRSTNLMIDSVDEHLERISKEPHGIKVTSNETDEFLKLLGREFQKFDDRNQPFGMNTEFKALVIKNSIKKACLLLQPAQESFLRHNDPRKILERKFKKHYSQFFTGKILGHSNAAVISSVLSSEFKKAIYLEMKKNLPKLIASHLMSNTSYPKNKMSLIAYALVAIGAHLNDELQRREESQESEAIDISPLIHLIKTPKMALLELQSQLVCYFCERENNNIAEQAELEAGNLINFTKDAIQNTTGQDLEKWIRELEDLINSSGNFCVDLPAGHCSTMTEGPVDIEEIKLSLTNNCENWWKFGSLNEQEMGRVAEFMIETTKILGCLEACPFCGSICDLGIPDHIGRVGHSCQNHWPSGLIGYHSAGTRQLCSLTCTSYVSSSQYNFRNERTEGGYHPYINYKQLFPEWDIPPDSSIEAAKYWNWLLANFPTELAMENAGTLPPPVSPAWKRLTFEDAKASISSVYNNTFNEELLETLKSKVPSYTSRPSDRFHAMLLRLFASDDTFISDLVEPILD